MSTRPRSVAGDPMTLANMRANGVRSLDVKADEILQKLWNHPNVAI